jgi:serine/threonine protein kinase/formylglycine-generating enzyme required for sulfatase activity
MSRLRTCPNGHPLAASEVVCPTCGTLPLQISLPLPTAPVLPTIPGYEILGELGRGGMGVVYKARQVSLGRLVALKMLRDRDFAGPDELERFRAEAEAVARLQHPNIVQIFEIGQHQGQPFFSLELVEGGSLAEKIAGRPHPAGESACLVETLARAAFAVHQRGILHRDLKPANILLRRKSEIQSLKSEKDTAISESGLRISDFEPKVSDFGLARPLEGTSGKTSTGAVLGTPSYMAPEQAWGSSRLRPVDAAADIYALGAILYEMVTGRPPFLGESTVDTLQQVINREPVPPRQLHPRVPRDLETICLKCLHKQPHKRYRSALELAEDLRRFRAGEPILARPTPFREKLWKWIRRRPAAAALWAGSVLVVIGATLGLLLFLHQLEKTRAETRAAGLVRALQGADTSVVPPLVKELAESPSLTEPLLRHMWQEAAPDSRERLHASLALLSIDPGQVDYLSKHIYSTDYAALVVVRNYLKPHQARLVPDLWKVLLDGEADGEKRLRAGCLLADYASDDGRWQPPVGPTLVNYLLAAVRQDPSQYSPLSRSLFPVREHLRFALNAAFLDTDRSESDRSHAANLLADFSAGRPDMLADLLLDADTKQFALLFPRTKGHSETTIAACEDALKLDSAPDDSDEEKERLAKRKASAAVILLRLARNESIWTLFQHSSDPGVRSYLIDRAGPMGAPSAAIIERLKVERDVSARRALLLCLGRFRPDQLQQTGHDRWMASVFLRFREDPDPGIHAAAEYFLRRGKQQFNLRDVQQQWAKDGQQREERLAAIRRDLNLGKKVTPQWYVNSQAQTMVVIPGPVTFQMGSPATESGREEGFTDEVEPRREKSIGRSYAIAAKEITVAEFLKFSPKHIYYVRRSPGPDCPINAVTWYAAAEYCNWLSRKEGIPEDQWCYLPNAAGKFDNGMRMRPNYLHLQGYRLPTEAEWEFACRAEASACRFYGESAELLDRYACYTRNTMVPNMSPVGSLMPNDLGIFDMLGNALEWCQDQCSRVEPGEDVEDPRPITNAESRVLRGGAFNDHADYVRCAHRYPFPPTLRDLSVGFRVARTIH